jgi:hypothetical protein
VLIEEEDATTVAWTLGIQQCGLFITLHQLIAPFSFHERGRTYTNQTNLL